MIKAIIYVRVSTDEQAEKGYSIESQIEGGRNRAYELGFDDGEIEVIMDDVSGGLLERPGLNRLRERVTGDEKPEIVIMFDPDRFARKLSYQLMLTDEMIKNGVKLEFINFEWKNTAEGRMYYQLRGMFAEYEREKIRERTIRGRMTKIKNHGKLSYDPRLYGYKFDTVNDVLLIDPETSKIVQLIFRLAAAGVSGEKIAKTLAEDGVPAPRGSKWYGSTVTRILKNKSYLGMYMAYKVDYHEGYRRKRAFDEQYPIEIQPLVKHTLFERAQETLLRNLTRTGRPAKRKFLIQGLGRCYCGHSINANVTSSKREHSYYACAAKLKSSYDSITGKKIAGCNSDYWNTQIVDEIVWEKVREVVENPGTILGEFLQQRKHNKTDAKDKELQLEVLIDRKKRNEQQESKLLDLYLADKVSREMYETKFKNIKKEQKTIHARIKEIRELVSGRGSPEEEAKENTNHLEKLKSALHDIAFEQKQQVVRLVVQSVTFQKNRNMTIIFNISLPETESKKRSFSGKQSVSESDGGP